MTQKHEGAEVSLKLVVDSNAKEETDRIKAGLAGIWGKAKAGMRQIDTGLGSNVKAIGGLMLGAEAMVVGAAVGGIGALVGLAHHSAEAFMESEQQVRSLAGTLSLVDQKGHSFERLMEASEGLKDELEDIAMQAGVTDDAMVAVFDDIIERGGKSVEEAEKLADAMAYAGRAIPGGAESLAAGFEQIQMGMVRAKNPLVQLISATGTLKGSAKSVAKEMQQMGIAEQMELAEKAIERMSGKMKQAPMTIEQMKTSMGVGIGNLFEEAGKPIVAALSPIVARVQSLFMGSRGGLTGAAKEFGELMAKGLALVVPVIDEVEAAIKNNWTEIKASVMEVYDPLKGLFDFIYKNRGAIAKTFVDVATVIAKVAGTLMKVVETTWGLVRSAMKLIVSSGAADLVAPGAKQALVDSTQADATAEMRSKVTGTSHRMGLDDGYKKEIHDKFVAQMQDSGASLSEAESAFASAYRRAEEDHNATIAKVGAFREAAIAADAESFAKAWGIATKAQDEGSKEYVANFLAQNRELVKQIAEKGPEILGEGFGTLLEKLDGMHSTIADEIRKGRKLDLGVSSKTVINQSFGNVTIKQDFRDQDPDRVAVVFRRDLTKYGTNRLQSGFSSPLGNF